MKLALAYVSPDTTEFDVLQLCEPYSSVRDVQLVESLAGGGRMLAIVDFADDAEAARAIAALDGTQFAGRPMRVRAVSETDVRPASRTRQGAAPALRADAGAERARAVHPRGESSGRRRIVTLPAGAVARAGLYVIGTLLLMLGFGCLGLARGLQGAGRQLIRATRWRHPLVASEAGHQQADRAPGDRPHPDATPD